MINDYSQPELFSTNRKPKFPVDVCANRHKGADTSVEANERANQTKTYWQNRVYEVILHQQTATLEEICDRLGKAKNELSGRVTELGVSGSIEICGKRNGFRVYRVKQ